MIKLNKVTQVSQDTPFHVDYNWFERNGQDVNVLIAKCMTPEQLEAVGDVSLTDVFDFVDPETGEITPISRAVRIIRETRAHDPEFITPRTPVAEAAFRVFLLNQNKPLTAAELAARIGRTPKEILSQLGGRVVYNGIKPL
jgi:hypothetical protein